MRQLFWVGCLDNDAGLRSVGDQAQILAIEHFLQDHFSDYEVKRFYRSQISDFFKCDIHPGDLIFIHSSGDFGDLYPEWHKIRKKIVTKFLLNLVVQLPVSVLYLSAASFEEDKIFFSDKKNFLLLCRSENDAAMLSNNFACRVEFFPDFAFYLKPELRNYQREGVLFVLRKDWESSLQSEFSLAVNRVEKPLRVLGRILGKDLLIVARSFAKKLDRRILVDFIKKNFKDATIKDVQVSVLPISDANRQKIVFDVLDFYQHFKLVITDRFHGLVFATLTNTPAIPVKGKIIEKTAVPNFDYNKYFNAFRSILFTKVKNKTESKMLSADKADYVLNLIRSRRSIRKWKTQKVPENDIKAVLEAGIWAPNACSSQATRFRVAFDPPLIRQVCQFTSPWFRRNLPNKIILVYYDTSKFSLNGWMQRFIWQDTACAMMNMMLMAEALGLKTCWASVNPEEAKQIKRLVRVPESYILTCMLLLGFSDQKVSLDSMHQGNIIRRREYTAYSETAKRI